MLPHLYLLHKTWQVWKGAEGQCGAGCGAGCGHAGCEDRKVARNETRGVDGRQLSKSLVCHTEESCGQGGKAGDHQGRDDIIKYILRKATLEHLLEDGGK